MGRDFSHRHLLRSAVWAAHARVLPRPLLPARTCRRAGRGPRRRLARDGRARLPRAARRGRRRRGLRVLLRVGHRARAAGAERRAGTRRLGGLPSRLADLTGVNEHVLRMQATEVLAPVLALIPQIYTLRDAPSRRGSRSEGARVPSARSHHAGSRCASLTPAGDRASHSPALAVLSKARRTRSQP